MERAMQEDLAERLRAYLDQPQQAIAAHAPPTAEAPDLFSLLAELAGLKNEVKLESRQLKAALDEFRGLFEALEAAQARAEEDHRRRREQERATQARERKDLLLELLDLRDRLQAGHGTAAGYRPRGLSGRRKLRAFAGSMAEGLGMNLRRLDEILARRGVQPLPVLGRSFDPYRMHAVELASDPERAHGEVVAELRPGFLLDDELLRPAEVVVNRPDAQDALPAPSRQDSE
ncbi:MAG: nucleotide exchange factor GrpE [Halochromatium sp.]|nr:nucleotide exchange factor GrpE [Halochromatium sp.]